jgi:hypothetical protein
VLVRCAANKSNVLYVGQADEKEPITYKVEFMRRQGETWKFSFSDKDDMSEIKTEDTVAKLPRPVSSRWIAHNTTLRVLICLFEERITQLE